MTFGDNIVPLVAQSLKTVFNNVAGIWIGIGTPELSAVSGDHNTIVMWDELNAGSYGSLRSNSQQVVASYFNGGNATLEDAFYWDSQGLAIPSGKIVRAPEDYPHYFHSTSPGYSSPWDDYSKAQADGTEDFRKGTFRKDAAGYVHVEGLLAPYLPISNPATIHYLPVGFRPPHNLVLTAQLSGGLTARLSIYANAGEIRLEEMSAAQVSAAQSFVSFNDIHFKVDS